MFDEIANSTPPSVASPAPVVEAPVAPIVAPVESPAIDAPSETPKPDTPVDAPAEAAPEAVKKAETLLGAEKPIEPEKPAEPEKPSEEKPAEEAPVEPASIPEFEPFTLPENVQFDAEKMSEFTKTLGEFENTTKASHEEVQKLGQQLVDRHLAEMARYTESLTQAWEKQKTDWKDSFLKDPEFANRTDTVVNAAIDAIDIYGGNDAQKNELRSLMESSGVGNHPALIRLLSNVMLAKAEPKPLAAPTIAPKAGGTKIEKMYGKKSG